jgi:RNA recognition motif-containing protein
MAELWVGNVPANVTDDELLAFLAKFGFPPPDHMERIPGDGTRPAAVLDYPTLGTEALRPLQSRIHGIPWHGRTLNVQLL